VLGPKLIPVYR